MKKSYKKFSLIAILMLSIIVVSCSSDDNGGTDETPVFRTSDDVREDFSNLTINAGTNDITLESHIDNVFWNFRIIAPEGASNSNQRPLVISLHGDAAVKSANAHKSTDCLASPGLASLNAYIISPNSDGFLWFDAPNQNQIVALVEMASTYLHVDVTKIAITGYSDGGNGSWFFAQFYPQLFSAAIPMASSYNPINTAGIVQKIDIPMQVIHGANDTLFPVNITEGYVLSSNAVGSDIDFIVAPDLIHTSPCDYVPYLQNAATWLQTEVWD